MIPNVFLFVFSLHKRIGTGCPSLAIRHGHSDLASYFVQSVHRRVQQACFKLALLPGLPTVTLRLATALRMRATDSASSGSRRTSPCFMQVCSLERSV